MRVLHRHDRISVTAEHEGRSLDVTYSRLSIESDSSLQLSPVSFFYYRICQAQVDDFFNLIRMNARKFGGEGGQQIAPNPLLGVEAICREDRCQYVHRRRHMIRPTKTGATK